MAKWIVDIKGDRCGDTFEISVVRSDNHHGIMSYGWFGDDKLLITHNGGPCRDRLHPLVWDAQVKLANEIANAMNDASATSA